jgi:hypothetical protein
MCTKSHKLNNVRSLCREYKAGSKLITAVIIFVTHVGLVMQYENEPMENGRTVVPRNKSQNGSDILRELTYSERSFCGGLLWKLSLCGRRRTRNRWSQSRAKANQNWIQWSFNFVNGIPYLAFFIAQNEIFTVPRNGLLRFHYSGHIFRSIIDLATSTSFARSHATYLLWI